MDTLLNLIRAGDRVTILVPNGIGRNGQEWKQATGRAVIPTYSNYVDCPCTVCANLTAQGKDALHCKPQVSSWALNMGGKWGTPGVATAENIVSVRKGGKR